MDTEKVVAAIITHGLLAGRHTERSDWLAEYRQVLAALMAGGPSEGIKINQDLLAAMEEPRQG